MTVPLAPLEKSGSRTPSGSADVGATPVTVSWVHVLAANVTHGPDALSTYAPLASSRSMLRLTRTGALARTQLVPVYVCVERSGADQPGFRSSDHPPLLELRVWASAQDPEWTTEPDRATLEAQ